MAQRIRQATPCTLRLVTVDQYGDPADRLGSVTVTVTTSAGVELVTAAATTHTSPGVYEKELTAAQVATLDTLTAEWTDTVNGVSWYTYGRVVGGFMFSVSEARAYEDALNDATKYPPEAIAAARDAVEDDAEWICDRSFVPAYRLVRVSGTGTDTLQVPVNDIRTVRTVTLFDTYGGTGVALTVDQLAAIAAPAHGTLRRTDGDVFPFGVDNIAVGIEYGLDGPNEGMKRATITHCRSRLLQPRTGIPDRARSVTDPNGATYTIAGADAYSTGLDAVDAVYARNSLRAIHRGIDGDTSPANQLPASGSLSYDPQWTGLFRGGPR